VSTDLVKLIAVGLPIALGVVMIGAGGVNFAGPAPVRESFARWGYPADFHRVTGGLEVATGLLLLIPVTSRVGAIGSAIILLAAVATLLGASAGRRGPDGGGGGGDSDPRVVGPHENLERLTPYALSVLRVIAALLFTQHGLQKLLLLPAEGPLHRMAAFWQCICPVDPT
jgi:uncharacterized membrane protein YphA (DoxX/SURF4 family)